MQRVDRETGIEIAALPATSARLLDGKLGLVLRRP
jgi:hypothetical protein